MAPERRPAAFTRPAPAPAARRPFLVFMRVGATDLLPQWLAAEPERNWDLFVSGYAPRAPHPAAVATVIGGYNKLEHFHECVKSGALDLSAYRYVLLADDDLAVTGGSISGFFETVERLGLTVAHPAQDWSGYWSHRIMLRNPVAEWRETNFVEVMCPCFETGFLARHLDAIPITRSTWGCDHAYCHQAHEAGGKVGIVDTAVIRHTKPIQATGAFYRKLAGDGIDPAVELETVLDGLPPSYRTHRVLGIHVRRGLLAPLRQAAARFTETHKRRIMKLCGHHQRHED
jgi:hypothetical protein